MARIRRQAVVVIHGIGEQRPMSTLRGLVAALLPDASVFSRPDTVSQSYELRRLTARHGSRFQTDFFEFYWADKVKGTTLMHLLQWALRLLMRWPWRVPGRVAVIWGLSWAFVITVVAGLGYLTVGEAMGVDGVTPWVTVAPIVLAVPQAFLVFYLGDAARYLSPSPRNVGVRKEIRQAGVDLLRRLHDGSRYDRVVVVGHSLGSVIAYDILRYYWAEVNQTFDEPVRQRQDRLLDFEDLLTESASQTVDSDEYRWRQRAAWLELQRHGFRWKVTDLVTVGSPLTHADLLLAEDERGFIARARDREYPTNPPQLDVDGTLACPTTPPITNSRGDLVSPRAPHHAALFCCTRWTNLFFPAAWGVLGDFVGGRLVRWFGEGIEDIPLKPNTWLGHTIFSHTKYWETRRQWASSADGRTPAELLEGVLDLPFKRDRPHGPGPLP